MSTQDGIILNTDARFEQYDRLDWMIDRLGNMQFIEDQAFADSDRLQPGWAMISCHPRNFGYFGAHP